MRFHEKISGTIPGSGVTFIYFLLDSDEQVIYIGRSKSFPACLTNHVHKEYTSVKFVVVPDENSDSALGRYILEYHPEHNQSISGYMTLKQIRDMLRKTTGDNRFSIKTVKKIISDFDIPWFIYDSGTISVPPEFASQICNIGMAYDFFNDGGEDD